LSGAVFPAYFPVKFGEQPLWNSKKPSPFADIARAQAGHGGVTHLHTSVNRTLSATLDIALDRVATAEKVLEAARSDARSAARRAGVSLSHLFGECSFIKRETGERWRDEARAAGGEQRVREIVGIFAEA